MRVILFGNEIDSIREFDVETQKSTNSISEFEITFSNEYIITEEKKEQALDILRQELKGDLSKELRSKLLEDIEQIEQNGAAKKIYQYFITFSLCAK